MRIRLLLALLLLLVATAVHAQEVEPIWLEVADIPLRLRSGPSTNDDVITQLTPREAVELLERGDQWSQIRRQDGLTGWAHNDYLLPWDERNRPDALRRVGERRLFRIHDDANRNGGMVTVNAPLRAISNHSYVYTISRNDNRLPNERALQRLGELFDEQIYWQSLELWDIREAPAIEGDERVVILIAAGFSDGFRTIGNYAGREAMPGEKSPSPRATGFISIRLSGNGADLFTAADAEFHLGLVAHEFRHMLHHLVGGNRVAWVDEGLAEFSAANLGFTDGMLGNVTSFLSLPRTRLNTFDGQPFTYGASSLFFTYLHERLGLEVLRAFAERREQGLAALDATLAEREAGLNADDFFADWIIANYLLDDQREGGRFGFPSMEGLGLLAPSPRSQFSRLPATVRDAAPPYTADYYEVTQPVADETDRLLLDFRLKSPAPQDAWLQLVQVLPERIDVQRFRASDYRGRPVVASLAEQPERVFVAVSPFTTSARQRSQPVSYSLALRQHAGASMNQAQVTTILRVRSTPEIADNVLGNLQRCSFVQVLQRDKQWSQIQSVDGLTGWSHNDFLVHRNASDIGADVGSCAMLARAAHDGDLAAVQRLLANGAPVNGADIFGRTALHEAAMWGHDTILARLLRAGADVHAQDAAGRTALDQALQSGNVSSLLLLGEAGANLDLSSPATLPLMIEAATRGNTALLELIIAEGHDVNWQDSNGQTALAAASANGQGKALSLLLDAGADTQWQDEQGRSTLMLAANSDDIGTLALLHEAGGDVNLRDQAGHNALTLAAANGNGNSVAWLLISEQVDVNSRVSPDDHNALHLAAAAGHDDVVALLLLSRIDVLAEDAAGQTARQLAGAAGHNRVVELLPAATVSSVANTTVPQLTGADDVAFLTAARNGNLLEVNRLIDAGIDLQARDEDQRTALMLAAGEGRRNVVLRLLLAGAEPNARQTGFQHHQTALYHAIQGGHDDVSAMLLLAGVNPSGYDYKTPGPLHWATEFGRPDMVRLLLNLPGNKRVSVDARSYGDKTPLHEAVRIGRREIVDLLLAAGADPNARDDGPAVPLSFAILWEHVDIVERLLAAGADPNGAVGSLNSPLELARNIVNNPAITRLLIEAGAQA